jgi:hypothetical protein
MVCQPLRLALLIGAITAVAVSPVRANFRAPRCCDPCGSSSSATAPAFRTVTCTEWVRETYTTKRTAHKVECKTETYDTFRCERVPVCKERTVTCIKRVPVTKEESRKVCCNVTVYEDRLVNKTSHKYVKETCMKKQLVRLGHWECKEVANLFGGGLFSGHGSHGCCDTGCKKSCGDPCKDSCRPTRTRKVWVHCPEYRECPVTVCKKVCVTEAVKCKVAVCKQEWKTEKVKVCTYQCVEEKRVEKYTCWETRKVACKGTRTVRVCTPYEETVTCCRMVPKTVTKQVPCRTACTNACPPRRDRCCESRTACCPREGFGTRLRNKLRCNSDCGRSTSCCK